MTFVDTNVFMYFVGAEHPRQAEARAFFLRAVEEKVHLVTSAEVLQELLHVYLSRRRPKLARAAFRLVDATMAEVWPVEREDVEVACSLSSRHPGLEARDLVHLACCLRRQPKELMTFDRALAAAWDGARRA